jgi:hypothetical protein
MYLIFQNYNQKKLNQAEDKFFSVSRSIQIPWLFVFCKSSNTSQKNLKLQNQNTLNETDSF